MRSILLTLFLFTLANYAATAQFFGKDWKQGAYFTTNGYKVKGLISWDAPQNGLFKGNGDHIFFKADSNAKKKKIESDTLKSFVIEKDSFTVSHFDELSHKPFLLVAVDNAIKLYYSSITRQTSYGGMAGVPVGIGVGGGTKTTYYYGTNPDNLTELDRKSFIDVMSKIMDDKPEVVAAIKNKEYKFGSINDLVHYYKTGTKL